MLIIVEENLLQTPNAWSRFTYCHEEVLAQATYVCNPRSTLHQQNVLLVGRQGDRELRPTSRASNQFRAYSTTRNIIQLKQHCMLWTPKTLPTLMLYSCRVGFVQKTFGSARQYSILVQNHVYISRQGDGICDPRRINRIQNIFCNMEHTSGEDRCKPYMPNLWRRLVY